MPRLSKVGTQVQIEIERLDGGLNVKDSPAQIGLTESPDCLNVEFDDLGSVKTREGTVFLNSTPIASAPIDGVASYNNTFVTWCNGSMYRITGSTPTLVTASSGKFTAGNNVAHEVYQQVLFMSDGTNAWKYTDPDNFYNMGIDIPSAPTGTSNTSGGDIDAGTWYYRVAFVNSQAVVGQAGSASAAVTLAGTGAIDVSDIPVGSALAGVDARQIFRSSTLSGTYRLVGEISDNSTTTFEDNTLNGAEGVVAVEDGTAPTAFTTIKLHRERLFFDDAEDRTILRYTNFENPYISEAANIIPLNTGDGSNITAIGVQEDIVSAFKTRSIWLVAMNDPSDDLTWQVIKSPSNYGIVGPNALAEVPNGIIFCGKLNERISGFHLLSGTSLVTAATNNLRTDSISEKIEPKVLSWPSNLWSKIAMGVYNNKVFISCPNDGDSTDADHILWFDLTRLGSDGQPGSWSLWDGIPVQNFAVHDGSLYGGALDDVGKVHKFNSGTYTDADGSAINSYYYTSLIGGEPEIQSWIKDFRKLNVWYGLPGAWNMAVKYRLDGDVGAGDLFNIDVTPGGSLWGTMVYGVDPWGGGRTDKETQHSLGTALGRRIQFRFDNENTAGQSFQVYRLKMLMNLRRELG